MTGRDEAIGGVGREDRLLLGAAGGPQGVPGGGGPDHTVCTHRFPPCS